MLDLSDVTLVSVYDNCHELALAAADECLKHARFGDVKLFTDKSFGRETVPIEPFRNYDAFAQYTNYELPKYIETKHALFFQWDGWIVNPGAWRQEFLDYDYIGAPWWYTHNNVGNSGFSLRSKRLLDYIAANRTGFPVRLPEDEILCRVYRPVLEREGFTWASTELAGRFAFERVAIYPIEETFGYHGMFNWPYILSYEEIEERVKKAPEYVLKSGHYREMREAMERRSR